MRANEALRLAGFERVSVMEGSALRRGRRQQRVQSVIPINSHAIVDILSIVKAQDGCCLSPGTMRSLRCLEPRPGASQRPSSMSAYRAHAPSGGDDLVLKEHGSRPSLEVRSFGCSLDAESNVLRS